MNLTFICLAASVFQELNSKICRENNLTRIGCWDHARRKFVEADKSADSKAEAKKGTESKTDVALSYIRKLYRRLVRLLIIFTTLSLLIERRGFQFRQHGELS